MAKVRIECLLGIFVKFIPLWYTILKLTPVMPSATDVISLLSILSICQYIDKTNINFVVTPCINNIQHFNFQLMHSKLKNVELLKHFKISKTAPTCFGLQGNHHQGATVST